MAAKKRQPSAEEMLRWMQLNKVEIMWDEDGWIVYCGRAVDMGCTLRAAIRARGSE